MVQEEHVLPAMNRKLSPKVFVFMLECVITKKNESGALASNTIDLRENFLGEDEKEQDICFERVVRDENL